jgi:hypothetical protein
MAIVNTHSQEHASALVEAALDHSTTAVLLHVQVLYNLLQSDFAVC